MARRRKNRTRQAYSQGAATVAVPVAQRSSSELRVRASARYDAAQTTDENRNHWAMADSLSAAAAGSPEVRSKLRNRARYEIANNSYASGMIRTLANDTIGTGPKLAMAGPSSRGNRAVSDLFWDWSESVFLAENLRLMRMAKCGDGEAIAVMVNNRGARRRTKLDLKLYETEQLSGPLVGPLGGNLSDGITYDDYGNPLSYRLLRYHPGGDVFAFTDQDFDQFSASQVIHWFNRERPGQVRGIPEIAPALPLYAQLRRYTLAVLSSAETAADFAAMIFSDLLPGAEEAAEIDPFDIVDLPKRTGITLPQGWKMQQLKAEQPTTTYEMFKRAIISEIARCLNMPYNVAAGDSSSYNYSSGRLDHRTYYKAIGVEQASAETVVVNKIFNEWWSEARFTEPLFPDEYRYMESPPLYEWHWDGSEEVDPQKTANAQETHLRTNTTTLAREYAKRGLDWEEQLEQRSREIKKMQELGLTFEESLPPSQENKVEEFEYA